MSQETVIQCDHVMPAGSRCRQLADGKCEICGWDCCAGHISNVLRLLILAAPAVPVSGQPLQSVVTMSEGLAVCLRCLSGLTTLPDAHGLFRDLLAHQLQELRDRTRAGLAQRALSQGRPPQP